MTAREFFNKESDSSLAKDLVLTIHPKTALVDGTYETAQHIRHDQLCDLGVKIHSCYRNSSVNTQVITTSAWESPAWCREFFLSTLTSAAPSDAERKVVRDRIKFLLTPTADKNTYHLSNYDMYSILRGMVGASQRFDLEEDMIGHLQKAMSIVTDDLLYLFMEFWSLLIKARMAMHVSNKKKLYTSTAPHNRKVLLHLGPRRDRGNIHVAKFVRTGENPNCVLEDATSKIWFTTDGVLSSRILDTQYIVTEVNIEAGTLLVSPGSAPSTEGVSSTEGGIPRNGTNSQATSSADPTVRGTKRNLAELQLHSAGGAGTSRASTIQRNIRRLADLAVNGSFAGNAESIREKVKEHVRELNSLRDIDLNLHSLPAVRRTVDGYRNYIRVVTKVAEEMERLAEAIEYEELKHDLLN